jgi:hypothetical protein
MGVLGTWGIYVNMVDWPTWTKKRRDAMKTIIWLLIWEYKGHTCQQSPSIVCVLRLVHMTKTIDTTVYASKKGRREKKRERKFISKLMMVGI